MVMDIIIVKHMENESDMIVLNVIIKGFIMNKLHSLSNVREK